MPRIIAQTTSFLRSCRLLSRLPGDFVAVLRSGTFMHSGYALRYLGSRRRVALALLHYLARGHRLGHWANPFVDPELRDSRGAKVSLADYLRRADLRALAPGRDFDPAWYRANSMEERDRRHPFLHFWRFGFDADAMPAPHYDLCFFKRVIAVHRPDKKEVAFEQRVENAGDPPASADDLEARQRAFLSALTFEPILDRPSGRAFLVFVQASAAYRNPFTHAGRSFDVLVNVYDRRPECHFDAEIVTFQTGTKTTAIHQILQRSPDLLLRYEAVLFLDDDVEIAGPDIDRAFALFVEHRLDLAQPSLTADSFCAFDAVKQPRAGDRVRKLSAVEIMMPIVSRRVLVGCGKAFGTAVSGWGVDFLLSKWVRERFGETIALLPQVVAAHRRPIDLEGGAFYAYLRRFGLDPNHEMGVLAMKYDVLVGKDAIVCCTPAAEPVDRSR